MVVRDIVHSCRHEKIAEAALLSIGGDWLEEIKTVAQTKKMSPGAFVAGAVRRFASRAVETDLLRLEAKISGNDLPLLEGLRMIVNAERRLLVGTVRDPTPLENHPSPCN